MRLIVCGARGSTPSSGPAFSRIGSHTSCVALARRGEAPSLVLDAGTGIRALGDHLGGAPFRGALVIGHLHWDHVMGLPFFHAADRPEASTHVLLPEQGVAPVELFERVMSPPFFPIGTDQLRGEWTFGTYDEGTFDAGGFTLTAREIPHKGGRTMGLRVTDGEHVVAYLSDHAPQDFGPGLHGAGVVHDAALALAREADVLLHDAQYTKAELATRGHFGHAAVDAAVELALAAGVRRLLLFHHDPARSDDQVDALVAEARELAGPALQVEAAGCGQVHDV